MPVDQEKACAGSKLLLAVQPLLGVQSFARVWPILFPMTSTSTGRLKTKLKAPAIAVRLWAAPTFEIVFAQQLGN